MHAACLCTDNGMNASGARCELTFAWVGRGQINAGWPTQGGSTGRQTRSEKSSSSQESRRSRSYLHINRQGLGDRLTDRQFVTTDGVEWIYFNVQGTVTMKVAQSDFDCRFTLISDLPSGIWQQGTGHHQEASPRCQREARADFASTIYNLCCPLKDAGIISDPEGLGECYLIGSTPSGDLRHRFRLLKRVLHYPHTAVFHSGLGVPFRAHQCG